MGYTSALNLGCTLDSTLEVLAHFQPERLCKRPDLVPELHPSASQWIRCLSLWDGVSPLSHLTIYTDGSFASRSKSASWAVAVTSIVDLQPVFVGFFSSCLFGESHHLFMGREADSAFPAEMAALVVALAICASQDAVSCRFVGDCTSALDIAGAVACPSHRTTLEQAMIDLHLIARARGNQMAFEHVKSHLGTPGNEFVDSAAKAAIHHDFQAPPELTAFCDWIQQRRFGSSRWFFSGQHQTGELPGLDDSGTTLQDACVPLPAFHAANTVPGIPVPLVTSPDMSVTDADWNVRLSTYNVNTIKREADRQLLDHMLSANRVHIAGLQETRCFPAAKFHTAHYQCFASADNRGNLGCQIWLSSKNPVAIRCDGHPVFLDHKAVTVVAAAARMLAICVPAGKLLFGVIAAHAPIEAAPDQEKQIWWEHLRSTIRKLPRRAIPVLLVDANARFIADAEADRVHLARADGENAVSLQSISAECDLQSTSFFDRNDQKVVTWTSPAGKNAQIDYVLLPETLADKSITVGAPSVAFEHAGIDHWPLLADVSWRQPTKGTRPVVSWDRKKLQTEAGRQLLRQIHQSAPRIPWTFHVEDHLQILNNHLYAGLCQHFQASNQRPRQQHVSDEQWQSIRMRRHVRRLASRSRLLRQRYVLAAILAAWRNQMGHGVNASVATLAHKQRRARALLNEARLGKLIKTLRVLISRLAAKDAAAHTRTVIRHSRRDGPAALFHALRGVLRTGRRYKPPLALPAISVNGTVVADPHEVRACLTEHFAEPEHGTATSVQAVVAQGAQDSNCPTVVALQDLPSVSSLVLSFLSMRDNKAAGISTIPSEVYKYAAIDAAHSHASLYIKIVARQQWPTLWRGVLATAIPKPNKHGALLTSWRSIALAEAAAKGIGRSIRQELAASLRHFATKGQHGSLPGEQIGIPAHHVLAFLQLAQKCGRSTAVIFLDGRSAYYATIREFLFNQNLDDPEALAQLLSLLIPDESLHDQAIAMLLGPGLLSSAGVATGLQDFLRAHLRSTWFTLQPCPTSVQRTQSGTTPGSPLADILYQFSQTAFMRKIVHDLAEEGLTVKVSVACDPADPQGWADDIAVMMPFSDPAQVESHLRTAIPILDRGSRLMGVPLNYSSGKTEALIALRGPHSVKVRRELLTSEQLAIPVPGQGCVSLRLVERYTHLGNIVSHSASCLEDTQAKSAGAVPVLRRLQQTLLRNPELSLEEKTALTEMLVIAKVEYGAGLWCPQSRAEKEAANTAFARPWRAVCRRLTGHSTKLLDDDEICAILGTLSSDEFLRTARVRQLLTVLAEGPGFLWHCLQRVQDWLRLACQDSIAVLRLAAQPVPACFAAPEPQLSAIADVASRLRRALRCYRKGCIDHRLQRRQAAIDKAEAILRCEAMGGAVFQAPTAPCGQHVCTFCPMRFVSKDNLAAHQSTVHQVAAAVSSATGTTCNVCRVEWWTTHRLKEHLRRSEVCRNTYQNADLPGALRHEIVGRKKERAFRPPAEVHGPLPWWATLRPPPMSQPAGPAAVAAQGDAAHTKLHKLADDFEDSKFCDWAPRAFAWLRCYSFQAVDLSREHKAFCAFQILAGIAEQAGSHSHLSCGGYRANKRGSLWWVEPA